MKRTLSLILLLLALPVYADEPRTIQITLSPETTYLMEPQLPDGRIDYLTVYNEQAAAQTTLENNLLVGVFSLVCGEREEALLREYGEQTEEQKAVIESLRQYRERFWKMIGLDAPPPLDSLAGISEMTLRTHDYYEEAFLQIYTREELVSMLEKVRENRRNRVKSRLEAGRITQEEYETAMQRIETETPDWYFQEIITSQLMESLQRPWTTEEFPFLARWLDATDDLSAKLRDMAKHRTGYYHPLFSQSDSHSFYDALLPYTQSFRAVVRLLVCRANWEFARGNVDEAMEGAFAAVRMGRTMQKSAATIVEELVGISMQRMGNHQLTVYLADMPNVQTAVTADWFLQKKKEFDAIEIEIGPLPWLPMWCLAERLGGLAMIQQIAVEPKAAEELYFSFILDSNDDVDEEFAAEVRELFFSGKEYDWDEVLRRSNFFYDDFDDIYWLPTWQRRLLAAGRLERRLREYSERKVYENPEQQAAAHLLVNYIVPSIEPMMLALMGVEWDRRVTSVAFALAAYRADNGGENPDTLEQLVPKYLAEVPNSPFTEEPLRYIKRANDVLIANDGTYKLDGSEEEVERRLAETRPGSRVFFSSRHFVFVLAKW
ncbi:MAG: hypothetical protein FWG73_02165 [Planctomycetaceae bacterium]|nr:hypothetical protein [Planctomycetaceae bacterium]